MVSYDAAFADLASRFRKDGWEARQEDPAGAYLHVSKPSWQDQNLDGIHLETYVLGRQLQSGTAPVAVHCEKGFPEQKKFMEVFTEKARKEIEGLGYQVHGPGGCSVCEIQVPLEKSPEETCAVLEGELRKLQTTLGDLIDQTIEEVRG